MTHDMIERFRNAEAEMLELSRTIPKRPCSPYGGLGIDGEEIKRRARYAFECLRAARIYAQSSTVSTK